MGSKSRICDELVKVFPKAAHFYDLFGGGFSVTHAMLLRRSRDFKHFHFNEIRPGICDLIQKAINGQFNYERYLPPWVSREEFFEKLDTDPLIKILWSFGNNGRNYLFGKEIEPYKRSMHYAVVFNEFDDLAKEVLQMQSFRDGYSVKDRRLFLRNKIEHYRLTKLPSVLVPYLSETQRKKLASGERLQQLERLQRFEQLERLQRLTFYSGSYESVPIQPDSVIYCDIPYANTRKYDGDFNHTAFFDWAASQDSPVFISEYHVPDRRFQCVWQIKKRSMLSADKTMNLKTEKLYANRAGFEALFSRRRES